MNKPLIIAAILVASIVTGHRLFDNTQNSNVPAKLNMNSYEIHTNSTIDYEQLDTDNSKTTYIDPKERDCLAKAIYWEARNQSFDGKIAVGFVVINRVNNGMWHNNVCDVVFQDCQFSWVCTKNAKKNLDTLKNEIEKRAWAESIFIANELLSDYNEIEDVTYGATFFHAHYVNPKWSRWKKLERTVRIDDHIFYRFREM